MDATVPAGNAMCAAANTAAASRYPDHRPYAGYYQSGPDLLLAVNVSAPDETTAEEAGAEILTAGIPSWIAVQSVAAWPLLAEPDFTSSPSQV